MASPTKALAPWLEPHWARVWQGFTAGRMGHALLFHGPLGVGKRSLAQRLSWALLCPLVNYSGVPCGNCKHCALNRAGTHPDSYWLAPEATTSQAVGSIKVDAIRQLSEALHLSPQLAKNRIAVISQAQQMNMNASNSLLKTLEEPPAGTYLCVLCEHPLSLSATIRSRCQQQSISVPPTDQALAWLREHGVEQDAQQALFIAGGAPFAALEAIANGSPQRYAAWEAGLVNLVSLEISPVKLTADFSDQPLRSLLLWLARWLAKVVRGQLGIAGADQQLVNTADLPLIFNILSDVADVIRQESQSLHAQLTLEGILADLQALVWRSQES